MNTIAEAHRYINSFARPQGFNNYSWLVLKKLALRAWECYLTNQRFDHSINFMNKDFYRMIQTPEGKYIVPEKSFIYDPML